MKIVKTYENFITKEVNDGFDPEFAMAKIKHFFSEYDVKNLVDDEIENWVDDSNLSELNRSGQEYETKREWYDDHGSGEAEEVVADQLANWYQKEFKKELTEEELEVLIKKIYETYGTLES